MIYPKMARSGRRSVEIPKLDGGINMLDAPTGIGDDQLTDAKNMWWRDGALRTRPGVEFLTRTLPTGSATVRTEYLDEKTVVLHKENATSEWIWSADGDTVTEIVNGDEPPGTGGKKHVVKYDGGYVIFSEAGAIYRAEAGATASSLAVPYVPAVTVNGRGEESEGGAGTETFEGYNLLTPRYKCLYTGDGFGKTFHLPSTDAKKGLTIKITLADHRNNRELKTHSLTLNPPASESAVVVIGNITGVTPGELQLDETEFPTGSTTCAITVIYQFTAGIVEIRPTAESGQHVFAGALPFVSTNNIEIELERNDGSGSDFEKGLLKICKMSKAVWFGGDRSGIAGGTRLFMSGNPDHKNLVVWSDVNDPLYFPELNYAYAGDSSQAVTAFGKMGALLVIFKEREMYYTQYVAQDAITTDAVMSDTVGDVTVYGATFPITPLSPNTGCDCPDTVRLVNNRLCWATSDGRVYVLTATNQFSEKNVREISGTIFRRLSTVPAAEMKKAVACEYCGYYMLCVGNEIFLCDADSAAYMSSYYRDDTAKRAIPWYWWQIDPAERIFAALGDGEQMTVCLFPRDGEAPAKQLATLKTKTREITQADVYRIANIIARIGDDPTPQELAIYDFDGDGDIDTNDLDVAKRIAAGLERYRDSFDLIKVDGVGAKYPIASYWQTKTFDFGTTVRRKAVLGLYLAATVPTGDSVTVDYITDRTVERDAKIIRGEGGDYNKAQDHAVYRLTPNIHRAGIFGVRATVDGMMAVEGMTIIYNIEGVTR